MSDKTGRQYTLGIIKPDAIGLGFRGVIIDMIASHRFEIIAIEHYVTLDRELVEEHYAEHRGRDYFDPLCSFMCSGHVTRMVLSKESNAIADLRELAGPTKVWEAPPGKIRALAPNGRPIHENFFHSSDSPESAKREIMLHFPELAHLFTGETEDIGKE